MFPVQLINICSSDGQRLYEAVLMGCLLAGGPLVGVLGLAYTTYFLGPTALVGSAIFIFFYPTMVRLRTPCRALIKSTALSLSLPGGSEAGCHSPKPVTLQKSRARFFLMQYFACFVVTPLKLSCPLQKL